MMKPYSLLFEVICTCLHAQQVTTILDAATQVDDALFIDQVGNLYGSHYPLIPRIRLVSPPGVIITHPR